MIRASIPWVGRGWPTAEEIHMLRCPSCLGEVVHRGARTAGVLLEGRLICTRCHALWPIEPGGVRLMGAPSVKEGAQVVQWLYDWAAPLHDPAEAVLLPLLQQKSSAATRRAWLPLMELDALEEVGRPVSILEVGVGTGGNVRRLAKALPSGLPVVYWGVDISPGMLAHARRRLRASSPLPYRLLLADAHALPFPDGAFDRVFHVGAAGTFADPGRALSELARVARPGSPIVIVDEELDPEQAHGRLHQAAFRALTFYDRSPQAPTDRLPADAWDVEKLAASRFYYALRYRMGGRDATG